MKTHRSLPRCLLLTMLLLISVVFPLCATADLQDTWSAIKEDYQEQYLNLTKIRLTNPAIPNTPTYVAYCLEASKAFPGSTAIPYTGGNISIYPEEDFEHTKISETLDNPRINPDIATEAIRNILFLGYPYNAHGIQERYNLTDGEFEYLTQVAIQYWSDRILYNKLV